MPKRVAIAHAIYCLAHFNRTNYSANDCPSSTTLTQTNKCFLDVCPNNRRSERILLPIILQHVAPGTTIITDKWKAYINLDRHGFIHHDVNHSRNFVDPQTGAHTNTIEGTWTHVKNRAQRRGGRRSPINLADDLTEFMRRFWVWVFGILGFWLHGNLY